MIFINNLDEVSNKKDKATEINTGDIVLVSVSYESKEVELGIAVKGNTLGQAYYVDITSLVTGEVHRVPLIDTKSKKEVMCVGGYYKTIDSKRIKIEGICDISINIDYVKRH